MFIEGFVKIEELQVLQQIVGDELPGVVVELRGQLSEDEGVDD